ncbi:MAG: helix-turn-helix domain-containing protein [Longimicrobiaceae bacterium]
MDDWPALNRAARQAAAELAVVDPHACGGLDVASCAAFRAAFPSTPLLPYGDFQGRIHDVVLLTAAGVSEVAVRDQDDAPSVFARLIDRAAAEPVCHAVMKELAPLIPSRLEAVVRHLLTTPDHCPNPACVAKLYFRHCNTLREHLRAAGLPPVNKLIVWTRLFHAAHLLGDPERTVEGVALALSFSSPSALRNQFQRYAGMTPQQVRAQGVAGVAERFRERFRTGAWDADQTTFLAWTAHVAPQSDGAVRERVCHAA